MKRMALCLLSFLFVSCSTSLTETDLAKALSNQCQGEDRSFCLTQKILAIADESPSELKPLFEGFSTLLKNGTFTDDPRLFSPIVHEIGMELAFNKISPEEAFALCPLNFKAGCLHGVIMESLDEVDSSDPLELASTCDFAKTDDFAYKNCIHGIGHELTAKTQGTLNEIVTKCKRLDSSLLSACSSGVFMEYSTGISGTGEHTHNEPIGSIVLPCNEVDNEFQATCYASLAAYRQYPPDTESFDDTAALCQAAPQEYQDNCMLGLAEKIVTASAEDDENALKVCQSLNSLADLCKSSIEQIKELESVL